MASSRSDRVAVVLAGLARLGRASVPVLRRLATMTARTARSLGRAASRHRTALLATSHRLMWWTALAMLVVGGPAVLGHEALPERASVLAPFVVGLVLCAALRLLAPAGHLRMAAFGLGALHGTAVVLVWTAFGG